MCHKDTFQKMDEDSFHSRDIFKIIGPHKLANAKENRVYIGSKSILKTFSKEFEINKQRGKIASKYNYGPKILKTGKLLDGSDYMVFERLNIVKDVEELEENDNEGYKQLEKKLKLMHKYGKHKHGDIHLGNILYKINKDGKKIFLWHDFDLGEKTARTKARRRKDLRIEIEELWNIRDRTVKL